MENNSGRNLIIALVAIVVLAIIAAVWLSVRGPENQVPSVNQTELGFEAAREANKQANLEVPDQFPGNIVYVSRAQFPAGGWVVVRKNNNGQPGDAIGSSFFSVNTRVGNIDLTEAIVDGQTYFAEAYTDDGDSQFDQALDALIVDNNGQPLRIQFRATVNLPERKG